MTATTNTMTTERILQLVLDHTSAIQAGNLHKSREAYAAIREALDAMERAADCLTIAYLDGHAKGVEQALAKANKKIQATQSCMAAVRRLLSRDPCVHAELAINMIDAVAPEQPK